jgi:hypothetical protein
MDEYEHAIATDADYASDDQIDDETLADIEHAVLTRGLRPMSGPGANHRRAPRTLTPAATSDVALGETSRAGGPARSVDGHGPRSAGRVRDGNSASVRPTSSKLLRFATTSRSTVQVDRVDRSNPRHVASVTSRADSMHFDGVRHEPAKPTHVPARENSLAFRPTLSRVAAHMAEHNAAHRFDTVIHTQSNLDAMFHAHRHLSLRSSEALDRVIDDEYGSSRRKLSPHSSAALREQRKHEASRQQRRALETRLALNRATSTAPGAREEVSRTKAQDEAAAVLSATASDGSFDPPAAEAVLSQRARTRAELNFRTIWHQPRNDDLRRAYIQHSGLKAHSKPFVENAKVFGFRLADGAVTAAFQDAESAAEAARPPRDSRPPTPRSIANFFNRGTPFDPAHSSGAYDSLTFEHQDELYGEELRRSVRHAVNRYDRTVRGLQRTQPRTGSSDRAIGCKADVAASRPHVAAIAHNPTPPPAPPLGKFAGSRPGTAVQRREAANSAPPPFSARAVATPVTLSNVLAPGHPHSSRPHRSTPANQGDSDVYGWCHQVMSP